MLAACAAGHQNLSEAALFCKSEPGWMGPDLQIAFVHVPFNIIVGQGHPNSVSILPGWYGHCRAAGFGWRARTRWTSRSVNPNYLSVRI